MLGYIGWATLSIAALFYVLEKAPPWARLIALFTPAIILELSMGQINLFLLALLVYAERSGARGHYYRLGACLTLLAIKPVNVLLPVLLLLWRHRQHCHKIIVIPIITFLLSLVIWGFWPVAYLQNIGNINPAPAFSVWELGSMTVLVLLLGVLLAWHTWRVGEQRDAALVLNLTLSPYIIRPHFVLLISWIARFATHHPGWAVMGIVCWNIFHYI